METAASSLFYFVKYLNTTMHAFQSQIMLNSKMPLFNLISSWLFFYRMKGEVVLCIGIEFSHHLSLFIISQKYNTRESSTR